MPPDQSYERTTHRISTALGTPVAAVIPAVPVRGPLGPGGPGVLRALRDRAARRRAARGESGMYLAVTAHEIVAFATSDERRIRGEIRRWPLAATAVEVDDAPLDRRRIVLRQPDGRAVGVDTPIDAHLAANLGAFLRAAGATAA